MTPLPDAWPGCSSGCGAPADLIDNKGHWWCSECFFDPTVFQFLDKTPPAEGDDE